MAVRAVYKALRLVLLSAWQWTSCCTSDPPLRYSDDIYSLTFVHTFTHRESVLVCSEVKERGDTSFPLPHHRLALSPILS